MKRVLFLTLIGVIVAISVWGLQINRMMMVQKIKMGKVSMKISPALVPLSADKLFYLVNLHRQQLGLTPFVINEELCNYSKARVDQIYQIGELDNHAGFLVRFKEYPYKISENLVGPAQSDTNAYKSWLESAPHRKAIEGSWLYSCITTHGSFAEEIFSSFDKINHNAVN